MSQSQSPFEPMLSRRASLQALGLGAGAFSLAFRGTSSSLLAAESPNWKKISSGWHIKPDIAYLNTGSLGSIPKSVLEKMKDINEQLESNPVESGFGPVLADAEKVRAKLAELFNCKVDEVTVTRNTTDGMNQIAEGLNMQPGQRVLTCNHEHGGGLGAWKYLVKRRGVHLDVATLGAPPASEDEVVESFRAAIRPETRVIMVSHVTYSSGVQTPIARLSELAHQHNCLMVVDGAQAPGGVLVDVKALGCDAYASSGHKWLLGPKGTGALYISEKVKDQITPFVLDDGYGVYTAIRGTSNWTEIIGLGESLDFIKSIGREAAAARLMELRNQLYEVVAKASGTKIFSPPPGSSMASHLVCFSVTDRAKHPLLNEQFKKDKVVVKTVGIEGIDYRVGCHLYNTEKDIARFAGSLKKVLG
jgi:selenocysteine lyase/cysteine desulfurase